MGWELVMSYRDQESGVHVFQVEVGKTNHSSEFKTEGIETIKLEWKK